MLELPECQENGFDGLHCPRWYGGGSCSYCGAPQPKAEGCTEPNRAACPRQCIDFCNKAEQAAAGVPASGAPSLSDGEIDKIWHDTPAQGDPTGKLFYRYFARAVEAQIRGAATPFPDQLKDPK